MKVLLPCYQCPEETRAKPTLFELEDSGIYVVECQQKHRTVHTISNPKFDILFEMALLALADGYTREAVATLAATTEEFFRAFVRMVLLKHKLYHGMKNYNIDLKTALIKVDQWCREARILKVAITAGPVVVDSGWGGVLTDGHQMLKVVYIRDSDEKEVEHTFDLANATASNSSIWDAAPEAQAKFGHFDEAIRFSLRDGRVILLACTPNPGHADN